MSRITKEINKITGTIIGISGKLILYALVILLLLEGVSRGYDFGYAVVRPAPVEAAPGTDYQVTVPKGQTNSETIEMLHDMGLIENTLAAKFQLRFYEYEIYPGNYTLNTSMTSKEMFQLMNEKPEEEEEENAAK